MSGIETDARVDSVCARLAGHCYHQLCGRLMMILPRTNVRDLKNSSPSDS
jgi:hypothetical protein